MTPVVISVFIWLFGLLVMLSGRFLFNRMRRAQHHIKEEAESVKFQDQSKSLLMGIEEKALGAIPWYVVRLFLVLIGATIIALGFVSVGFWSF